MYSNLILRYVFRAFLEKHPELHQKKIALELDIKYATLSYFYCGASNFSEAKRNLLAIYMRQIDENLFNELLLNEPKSPTRNYLLL